MLEDPIAAGRDTKDDREAAWDLVQLMPADTAGDAFGRAAIAGRLAEKKGALAVFGSESPTTLVAEAERYAQRSRKLDPSFRSAAATRLLGALYVHVPQGLLDGGTQEDGLDLLIDLAHDHPEVPENQLRLADAYIFLGDDEPAKAPLCLALRAATRLRADDARLARQLAQEIDGFDCHTSPQGATTAPTSGPQP